MTLYNRAKTNTKIKIEICVSSFMRLLKNISLYIFLNLKKYGI